MHDFAVGRFIAVIELNRGKSRGAEGIRSDILERVYFPSSMRKTFAYTFEVLRTTMMTNGRGGESACGNLELVERITRNAPGLGSDRIETIVMPI